MEKTTPMTYREISKALGIKIDSAKALRRRKKWSGYPANSGREYLVNVPIAFLEEARKNEEDSLDITTHDSSDITAGLIAQLASAHENIGELKLRLTLSEALNEKNQKEISSFKEINDKKDAEISSLKAALKEHQAVYEDIKNKVDRRGKWWLLFFR